MALSTSLTSYWKLDGNSNDSVGSNNGTDTSVTYSSGSGKLGQGGAFTSAGGSKIATAYQFPTSTGAKSFSVWFKPSSGLKRGWIIGGGTDGTAGYSFGLFLATDATGDLYFFGFGAGDVNYGNVITASVWQHVVISYDGTNVSGYLNGVLLSTVARTLNTGAGNMYIGSRTDNTSSWDGDIDEVGVWNKALTADEVSQLYNSFRGNAYPLTDTPSLYGCRAYYKLDESSGDAVDTISSATLTNTNTVGYASALINNGADFGATNTNKYLVQSTNDYGTDGGAISISMWVKMQTEIGSGSQGFVVHGGATSHVNDMIGYDYNAGTRRLAWNRQQKNTANNVYYHTATLGTSTWHHLVYTYDGVTMKGYYDGTEVVSQALSGNGASGTGDGFGLGGTNRGGGNEWYGYSSCYQDEVCVFNRALSSTEVTALYNSGSGIQYPWSASFLNRKNPIARQAVNRASTY